MDVRLVCVADEITCNALMVLGVRKVVVSDDMSKADLLAKLQDLLKDRKNVILLGQSIASKIEKEIEELQKEFSNSVMVVIPDVKMDLKMDIDALLMEVVGGRSGS